MQFNITFCLYLAYELQILCFTNGSQKIFYLYSLFFIIFLPSVPLTVRLADNVTRITLIKESRIAGFQSRDTFNAWRSTPNGNTDGTELVFG